ncbi:MAG: hypothetical protein IJM45_08365 [Clostridia bacterium]|nr:hypothetical protein [Clostridia bacterium]
MDVKKIRYVEPEDYFPKEIWEKVFGEADAADGPDGPDGAGKKRTKKGNKKDGRA